MSAYLEAAVQRQIERDNLDELIAPAEAEHGRSRLRRSKFRQWHSRMTLGLDSEGLAKAVLRDRELTAWLAAVEVIHPRISRPAFDWLISRLSVEPVTAEIARQASALLEQVGWHGHKYAIDAMVAATALAAHGPATVLTSDP